MMDYNFPVNARNNFFLISFIIKDNDAFLRVKFLLAGGLIRLCLAFKFYVT